MIIKDLMDGTDWTPAYRVRGWVVQEKMDGWRALWTGSELVTREGVPYRCPSWFIAGLPAGIPLDGELYAGRRRLRVVQSIAGAEDAGNRWADLRFVAFDAPNVAGCYGQRWEFMRTVWHDVAPILPSVSLPVLKDMLRRLHADGGEGFMLRNPNADYRPGRTRNMMKFKSRSLYSQAD